jgi:hypothetical protein
MTDPDRPATGPAPGAAAEPGPGETDQVTGAEAPVTAAGGTEDDWVPL